MRIIEPSHSLILSSLKTSQNIFPIPIPISLIRFRMHIKVQYEMLSCFQMFTLMLIGRIEPLMIISMSVVMVKPHAVCQTRCCSCFYSTVSVIYIFFSVHTHFKVLLSLALIDSCLCCNIRIPKHTAKPASRLYHQHERHVMYNNHTAVQVRPQLPLNVHSIRMLSQEEKHPPKSERYTTPATVIRD